MKYTDFQRSSDYHKNVFTKLNCVKGLLIKTSSIQLCTAIDLPNWKNRTKKTIFSSIRGLQSSIFILKLKKLFKL